MEIRITASFLRDRRSYSLSIVADGQTLDAGVVLEADQIILHALDVARDCWRRDDVEVAKFTMSRPDWLHDGQVVHLRIPERPVAVINWMPRLMAWYAMGPQVNGFVPIEKVDDAAEVTPIENEIIRKFLEDREERRILRRQHRLVEKPPE